MFSQYFTAFKVIGALAVAVAIAWFSYDYGVTTTQHAAQLKQDELWEKVENKQNEAYLLAVELAEQTPAIQTSFKSIKKGALTYVEKNSNRRRLADDTEWLCNRAAGVRAYNQAIGIQQPAPCVDGAPATADGSNDRIRK